MPKIIAKKVDYSECNEISWAKNTQNSKVEACFTCRCETVIQLNEYTQTDISELKIDTYTYTCLNMSNKYALK